MLRFFALACRTLPFAGLLLITLSGAGHSQENPVALAVAVSIKPLHSLIANLMQGTGSRPTLIVSGGASPHAYSLKPSDARKLSKADIIFWIGPGMENFLIKPLQSLADTADIVTFTGQGQEEADPHIWLSPVRASDMVKTAVARLLAADPANAALYRRNGAKLRRRLAALQAELEGLLRKVRAKPFIVYHDAYRHLAEAFGLNIAGVVTAGPDRQPGARRIADLGKLMSAGGVSCLFAGPQVDPRRLDVIVENVRNARIGTLDPLGTRIPAGPEMYFTLLRATARALVDCLSGRRP